jgi:hypothetical protein
MQPIVTTYEQVQRDIAEEKQRRTIRPTIIQKERRISYEATNGKPMLRLMGDYLSLIGMPTGKTVHVLITPGRIIISLGKEIEQ